MYRQRDSTRVIARFIIAQTKGTLCPVYDDVFYCLGRLLLEDHLNALPNTSLVELEKLPTTATG
jgi:hypothetical protein